MAADTRRLGFLTWSSSAPTGGNLYDDRLTAALRASGVDLHRHRVAGIWPGEAERHREEVAAALRSSAPWLVDSIIACAVPDLVAETADRGHPVTILLHSLLSTEVGLSDSEAAHYRELESAALRAAGRVVTTSQWAAGDLHRRYRITHTVVARPGVDPAPLAPGTPEGSRLLSLGSLTPTKDQLAFVTALSRLRDLSWSAHLVGDDGVRPDYTAELRRGIGDHDLPSRITITGPLVGATLERVWAATDLLVLTSRSETYGMVVVEALAHGIPAVVTAETGAVEALGDIDGELPGATVPIAAPDALAAVLRGWLTEPERRARWRATARRRREQLSSWADCAAVVQAALAG